MLTSSIMYISILVAVALAYLYFKEKSKYQKYSNIINLEEEVERLENEKKQKIEELENAKNKQTEELNVIKSEHIKSLQQIDNEIENLKNDYKEKLAKYKSLIQDLTSLEEEYELTTYGFYKINFEFNTSEEYKHKLEKIRESQKVMITNKNAVVSTTDWRVNGSKAEGKKLSDRAIKLTLRAFNGECDAIIANVKWNNYNTMRERLLKTYQAIEKLNASNQIIIVQHYLDLKLEELKTTYEYQEKLQEEKEEQRAIREQMREEEKAQREFEKAQRDAEKEEEYYQKALNKAKAELANANNEEMQRLEEQIKEMELKLKEAEAKKERAISQAQQTRSGFVYIISNIGSFGENVYKIGMTRRLEPLDRVRELGDASVPFLFDVHAMIYSEDAPKLEKDLHNVFAEKRVNLVNYRKEFFKVTLEEIENEVTKFKGDIEFIKFAEAKEYRESIAMLDKNDTMVLNENVRQFKEYQEEI